MHNLETVLEIKTHRPRWDFEIQTDHLISARQPDLAIVKKKKKKRTCGIKDFNVLADHREQIKESEK